MSSPVKPHRTAMLNIASQPTNQQRNLLILGAGGFGREVLQWAKDCGFEENGWRVAGFIDDNRAALENYPNCRYPIIAGVEDFRPGPLDYVACAIGLPKVKKKCVELLLRNGAKFVSIVHPSAIIGGDVEIGDGSVICPGVILTRDVRIGDFVTVNLRATLGPMPLRNRNQVVCGT